MQQDATIKIEKTGFSKDPVILLEQIQEALKTESPDRHSKGSKEDQKVPKQQD